MDGSGEVVSSDEVSSGCLCVVGDSLGVVMGCLCEVVAGPFVVVLGMDEEVEVVVGESKSVLVDVVSSSVVATVETSVSSSVETKDTVGDH